MSELTVQLILLLLPGALSALVVERLTVHPTWSQFRFVLYSILLGAASYATLDLVLRVTGWSLAPVSGRLSVWGALATDGQTIPSEELLLACVVGLLLGLLLTRSVQNKWLHRLGKRLGATTKYGDENLFSYFLASPETDWVFISDKEKGLTYEGLLQSFSESERVREVLLLNARVYTYEDSSFLYELKHLYLSFAPGELAIESRPQPTEPADG